MGCVLRYRRGRRRLVGGRLTFLARLRQRRRCGGLDPRHHHRRDAVLVDAQCLAASGRTFIRTAPLPVRARRNEITCPIRSRRRLDQQECQLTLPFWSTALDATSRRRGLSVWKKSPGSRQFFFVLLPANPEFDLIEFGPQPRPAVEVADPDIEVQATLRERSDGTATACGPHDCAGVCCPLPLRRKCRRRGISLEVTVVAHAHGIGDVLAEDVVPLTSHRYAIHLLREAAHLYLPRTRDCEDGEYERHRLALTSISFSFSWATLPAVIGTCSVEDLDRRDVGARGALSSRSWRRCTG